jgi:ATP-binding cassette, subfamily B, bacterial
MLLVLVRAAVQRAGGARLLPALRALGDCEPRLTLLVAALSIAAGLLPAIFALLTGALVGALPHAVGAGLGSAGGHHALATLLAIGALLLGGDLLAAAQNVAASLLGARFTWDMRARALAAMARPTGIAHLEDPALREKLTLVLDGMRWDAGELVSGGAVVLTRLAQGLAAAALVATFSWWAALLLASVWLGAWASAVRVVTGGLFDQLAALRRSWYLRDVATRPQEAKEVRLFGMHPWLLERYTAAWRAATTTLWQAGHSDRRAAAAWLVVVTAAHALVFIVVALAAASHLTVSGVAVLVQAILAMAALGEIGGETWIENGLRVVAPVLALEHTLAAQRPSPVGLSSERSTPGSLAGRSTGMAADLPVHAIRFEGVRFRYAGRADEALAGFDLEIPAGRSLAIVGDNGAGKTTLVKLLCRLYDPDEGHITVDGRDLRTIEPFSWRQRVSAVFQDFVRYELSAADNVGFGAPRRRHDKDALRRAAARAGALDLIDSLPRGWETILSPRYEGGVDLSGGQWQRIALARALVAVEAGARVLILDEPTAALDVRAEAELFNRFLSITQGLTTILVSHRFSTVRRADRIVVLDGGRVVEQGTHDELLVAGGRYARMFLLQAGRFNPAATKMGGEANA